MNKDRKRTGPEITDINQCLGVFGYDRLTKAGKAIYRARCRELISQGSLMFVDLVELILYAHCCTRYWEAFKTVEELGGTLTYVDRMGNTRYYANPAVKVCRDYLNDINAIGSHFGFNPLSRKKLGVIMEKDEDPVEVLLKMVKTDTSKSRKPLN